MTVDDPDERIRVDMAATVRRITLTKVLIWAVFFSAHSSLAVDEKGAKLAASDDVLLLYPPTEYGALLNWARSTKLTPSPAHVL